MKTKHIGLLLSAFLLIFLLSSCEEEKDWSEDYDIDFPVSTISSVSPLQQTIGGEVTISGENLEHVLFVSLGNLRCDIVSQTTGTIVVTIPENAEKSYMSVENKYQRVYVFEDEKFTPIAPSTE